LALLAIVSTLNYADAAISDAVTCGSVTKLLNSAHRVRLHSHDVKYGSGSGQQSVTAIEDMDDHNSHWQILNPFDNNDKGVCVRGTPVACGTNIRLMHMSTGCLLHSHLFTSPLSRNQEVSCFGSDGKGDSGDNWQVICLDEGDDFWRRTSGVKLKHVDTGTFLSVPGHKYGRPIQGQMEVATTSSTDTTTLWKTKEGVFIMPSQEQKAKLDDD